MIDKFGKKGFSVVSITDGPEGETKKFVEDAKLKGFVIFEKPLKSMAEFGFEGYPSSALIGPTGKVLWTGHPGGLTEKIIEDNLTGVTLTPTSDKLMLDCELPKKYAAAAKHLSTGKLGEGRTAIATALAAKELKEADKPQLEAALAEVDKLIADEMKSADDSLAAKRCFEAQTIWKRMSGQCRGLDAAKSADEKLAALAKDASLKRELDAGQRIAEAQKLVAADKVKAALSALKSLTEGPLKDTEEAKRAVALAEELKKA